MYAVHNKELRFLSKFEIEGLKKVASVTKSSMLLLCTGKPKDLQNNIKTKTIEQFLLGDGNYA